MDANYTPEVAAPHVQIVNGLLNKTGFADAWDAANDHNSFDVCSQCLQQPLEILVAADQHFGRNRDVLQVHRICQITELALQLQTPKFSAFVELRGSQAE